MSYHYFETEPILEKVEFDDSFLILANPAPKKPNVKSKEDKEHNARVQAQADGLRKSLEMIATGHVNLYNRPIELDNIIQCFDWWENFDNLHIYYCKPTSARKPWSRYNNYNDKVQTYEFDVVRTFISRDELVTFLIEHYNYAELIAKILASYSYANEGYDAKLKSYVEYTANLVPDARAKGHRWNDELYWVAKRLDNKGPKTDSNLLWAMQNGYVTVDASCYDSDETIGNLCNKQLYTSLLEYAQRFDLSKVGKLTHTTKQYLTEASGSPAVKETIKLLGLKTPRLVLVIVETGGYGADKELERVELKTMDEVKTYIIKHYDVSFSDLEGDVDHAGVWLNDERRIEFRATVTGQ
jgi:hypothetical protein